MQGLVHRLVGWLSGWLARWLGGWLGVILLGVLVVTLLVVGSAARAIRADHQLQQAADAAALAGALAIDLDAYSVHGVLGPSPLDADAARIRAMAAIADMPGVAAAVVEQVRVVGPDVLVHLRMPLFPDPPGALLGLWAHARSHASLVYEDAP